MTYQVSKRRSALPYSKREMCQLYSICTSKLQSKKAFVNHGQRFLFAEDFSIVSATVSLRCDLTSIARSPTETIKTTRARASDNFDDDEKVKIWSSRIALGEVMMTNSERCQAQLPLEA